jgi:hypothetical protein
MATGTLTDLLERFGVKYADAPEPNPALLAFVRGLGMTMDEAEDFARRGEATIKRRSEDARGDVERASARSKRNVTADLLRRGVLSSGEANTRYAEHAEDKASRLSDIARGGAEGIEAVQAAFAQAQGGLRTKALETTLGVETSEDARKAMLAAQTEAFERDEASAEKWFKREQEAQENFLQHQINLMKGIG